MAVLLLHHAKEGHPWVKHLRNYRNIIYNLIHFHNDGVIPHNDDGDTTKHAIVTRLIENVAASKVNTKDGFIEWLKKAML